MAGMLLRSLHQCRKTKHSLRCLKGFLRTLLTDAYRCDQIWLDRLKSPVLSQVKFNKFSIQVLEKLDKQKNASLIDLDILANKLHEMGTEDEDMVQNILKKFRTTQTAYPVSDAVNHAIIRSYIQRGQIDTLFSILRDKQQFGVFPDPQVASLLMDHCLRKDDFAGAAKIAYELMLQEDFSHPTSYLLSLYSCVKHLYHTDSLERWEPAVIDPEAEINYIPVSYIRIPFYDDHFDIQNKRFLLGKTLYYLGKEMDSVIGRSLQLIGLGLYEKFSKANQLLEQWMTAADGAAVVTEDAVKHYTEYLSEAPTRDPDTPEKPQGERTVDDEIMKLRLTPEEKESCLSKYQELQDQLKESNRISEDNIETFIETYVKTEVPKHEDKDIEILKSNYEEWEKTRLKLLEIQTKEYLMKQKEEEILRKFIEIQEKEEVLTFFEKENELELAGERVKKIVEEKVDEEEEYVEAPGEREVKKKKMKKK